MENEHTLPLRLQVEIPNQSPNLHRVFPRGYFRTLLFIDKRIKEESRYDNVGVLRLLDLLNESSIRKYTLIQRLPVIL